jgi:hypothetical protein
MNTTHHNHLKEWLDDKRTARYFGRAWKLKSVALSLALTGQATTPAIARRLRVTPEGLRKYVRRAQRIFEIPTRNESLRALTPPRE